VESARGDEQDVVGLDRAMLGRHRGSFDQGQQIALHALARDVAALAVFADADLVDLVQEHDAVVFDRADRFLNQLVVIQQLVGFLVDQNLVRAFDGQPPGLGAAAHLAEDVADRDRAHLGARHPRDLEHRKAAAGGLGLDLDFLVVELAGAQPLAKRVARGGAGVRSDQRVKHAFLGGELGARLHVLALAFPHLGDRDLDEIPNDLLDVAADIADLGELGGLDLDEGRAREFRQPPRDLGLADAGRADHQDVLRQHLLAQTAIELQPPPAVAQRDGHRALGVGLADDEPVEFGDDFTGGEVCHGALAKAGLRSGQVTSVTDHQERRAVRRIDQAVPFEPGLFIGAHRAAVGRIGIGHDPRRPGA